MPNMQGQPLVCGWSPRLSAERLLRSCKHRFVERAFSAECPTWVKRRFRDAHRSPVHLNGHPGSALHRSAIQSALGSLTPLITKPTTK